MIPMSFNYTCVYMCVQVGQKWAYNCVYKKQIRVNKYFFYFKIILYYKKN